MRRRLFLAGLIALPASAATPVFPPVVPGRRLVFPEDTGAHPDFRTEWWYATGWLKTSDGRELGFQVTFFRVRTGHGEGNPSSFAPRQLIMAHAALADPRHGRLTSADRAMRAFPGLASAGTGATRVEAGDWHLQLEGSTYLARITDAAFGLDLKLVRSQPVMLNGDAGFSRKAPDERHASYYYSEPQLRVEGSVRQDGKLVSVTGSAWLDHEWSSELLPAGAQGWDWTGINLDDGGALMAFRMRGQDGSTLWTAGTLRGPDGRSRKLMPQEIRFRPLRSWRSPRSAAEYPVEWEIRVGSRNFRLTPLMDDQELDSRRSTGAFYWEGAVRLVEEGRTIGRGYLEMTGYGERLKM